MIEYLLEDIYEMASLVKRLTAEERSYRHIMAANEDLTDLRSDICGQVRVAMNAARGYADGTQFYRKLFIV